MTFAESSARNSTPAEAMASTVTSSQIYWSTNGLCMCLLLFPCLEKRCLLIARTSSTTTSEMTDKPATDKKAKDGASTSTEAVKVTVKKNQTFVPFTKALQHSFESISAKKQKKMNAMLWATLGGSHLRDPARISSSP